MQVKANALATTDVGASSLTYSLTHSLSVALVAARCIRRDVMWNGDEEEVMYVCMHA